MAARFGFLLAGLFAFASLVQAQPTTAPSQDAASLADQVMKASGADVWPKVSRIEFTFGGRFHHDWDVKNMTDTVTTNGKSVTVNIMNPGDSPDAKRAFARWTNDTYWLLAPLKIKDPGVTLSTSQPAEIDGKTYDVLHLSFKGVGLTPGDQYNMYIDPETHLVRWWDYMPAPGKKTRMSWDDYNDFNGLKIATEHKMPNGSSLKMSDIKVTVE